MIFWEKINLYNFFDFFFKGGTLWSRNWKNIYFNFSKFTKFFLKDDLNGTYKMFKETKSWSMSSFEVSTEDLQGIYGGVGKICPALPQIGLITMIGESWTDTCNLYIFSQVLFDACSILEMDTKHATILKLFHLC